MIGAEISGIDLRDPISETDLRDLRTAWAKYGVLFFRNQPISRETHIRFGQLFADLIPPVVPINANDYPELHSIIMDGKINQGAADIWHADLTCFPRPSCGSILRAYVVPSLGGDTAFSNAAAAYAGLPDEMKERIKNLRAVHDITKVLAGKAEPDKIAEMAAKVPPVEHPVVRVHPETKEPVLYVNAGFTTRIVGLEKNASDDLLRELFDAIKRPEYQVRFAWQVDSIAFWDNRKVQHYAVTDYNEPRHLESVVLLDDVPYGLSDARAAA